MLNHPNLEIDRLEKDIGHYFMADRYFSVSLGSVTYRRAMFHGKVLGWVTRKYNYLPFVMGKKRMVSPYSANIDLNKFLKILS